MEPGYREVSVEELGEIDDEAGFSQIEYSSKFSNFQNWHSVCCCSSCTIENIDRGKKGSYKFRMPKSKKKVVG